MTELLTAAQMRAMEAVVMDSGEVTGLELMERAGQGVVDAIFDQWPKLANKAHAACVLCGPGNNGGDGFVIARLLADQGWTVRVHFYGTADALPPDAQSNHDLWAQSNPVAELTLEAVQSGPRPDVIVDAVFGIGLKRPVADALASVLDVRLSKAWKCASDIRRVAVDCPSGLDLDTGLVPTDMERVKAKGSAWPQTLNMVDLTVTFHAPKLGHYLAMGPNLCRDLKVVDIGLGQHGEERSMIGLPPDPESVRLVEPHFAGRALPLRIWPASNIGKSGIGGHKYDHGHVLVFSGGVGRGGAARLAARAALRCGAGLVTVVCPPSALIENACQLNAIMLRSLPKDSPLSDVADHRISAFCLGPGMGVSERTRQRVIEVLNRRADPSGWRDPAVVLDADALTSFKDDPAALFAHTHARTVLTPHEGEFARLFPDIDADRRRKISKVEATRRAAERAGCIVLLKGPDTVIAAPCGGASVHAAVYGREAPWLATAGAGDVLAGLIAGLGANHSGSDLFQITEVAAYLHVEAARSFGPGLIAEDLPEELPKVFCAWGI